MYYVSNNRPFAPRTTIKIAPTPLHRIFFFSAISTAYTRKNQGFLYWGVFGRGGGGIGDTPNFPPNRNNSSMLYFFRVFTACGKYASIPDLNPHRLFRSATYTYA